MLEEDVIKEFARVGAIVDGHFVGSSGKHLSKHVDKAMVFTDVRLVSTLCGFIADQFLRSNIQVVIGPALGGIVLAQWIASALRAFTGKAPLALFAEKWGEGGFVLTRQYAKLVFAQRVLVVEDIITSGDSVKKVIEAVRQCGGKVVGVGALWNRGDATKQTFGDIERFFPLVSKKLDAWDADKCPLCVKGVPLNTELGHGKPAEKLSWNFEQERLPT